MNHIEGRLLKMGFSMEAIEQLSKEDRTYLATGLTRYEDIYYDNPWYTPGGAANVSDYNNNMDDQRINEILNRLTKVESDIEKLKQVAYDNVSVNRGVLDLSEIN